MMKKFLAILLLTVSASVALADTPPNGGTSGGGNSEGGPSTQRGSAPVMIVPVIGPQPDRPVVIVESCPGPSGFTFGPDLGMLGRQSVSSTGSRFDPGQDLGDLGRPENNYETRYVYISYGGNYHGSYFEIDCDNNDLGIAYAEFVNRTTGESTGPYRPQAGIVRVPVSQLSGTWVIIVEPATGGYYSGEFRVQSDWYHNY